MVVVNEDGQVVTWQLTNSTSFSEVTPLLCALHDRIDLPKDEMLTVYVAMLGQKLRKCLGQEQWLTSTLCNESQKLCRRDTVYIMSV